MLYAGDVYKRQGVSCAVREAACPKVFIPNLGTDPELFGLTVQDQVAYLLRFGADGCPAGQALNWLLVDEDESRYPGGIPCLLYTSSCT